MKSVSILSAGTAAVIIALGSGCTHVASSRHRVTNQLTEHSRAFTTAVVDALQLQPTDQRDQFTSTALQLAQLDQRVEGFPLKPIPVEELIDPTGSQPQAQATARADLASRELTVQKLLSKQHQNEERLLAFGERFEVERNQQRLRAWPRWWAPGWLTRPRHHHPHRPRRSPAACCVLRPKAAPRGRRSRRARRR